MGEREIDPRREVWMRGVSIEVNEAVEDVEELAEEVGRGVFYANLVSCVFSNASFQIGGSVSFLYLSISSIQLTLVSS